VERAKKLYPQANRHFIIGNAYILPYKTGFADAAFSVNVWFHLEDINKAARELSRILKINGKFLIITADPAAYDIWESFFHNYKKEGNKIVGQFETPVSPLTESVFYLHPESRFKKSLAANGLAIDKITTMSNFKGKDLFMAIEGHKK